LWKTDATCPIQLSKNNLFADHVGKVTLPNIAQKETQGETHRKELRSPSPWVSVKRLYGEGQSDHNTQ